jgi:hypothetical protein
VAPAEAEAVGAALAALSSADAFAAHSIALAPAKIAAPRASRNTRFIGYFAASYPPPRNIVEELGRRVNSQ